MVRKLAAAMLGVGVFIPGLANALGLGEIKLNSALSEPLDAEIELVQVRELTSGEILPGLAGDNDFANAHIERFHFLTDLRFKVEVNPQGRSIIKVTSKKPVKEPFLNFLVEVNWPAGRLLREYTLLLDPPVYSSQKAEPVKQATSAAPVPRYEAQPPHQTYSSGGFAQAPTGSGDGQVQTHTIGSNDSLWSIAQEMKPSDRVNVQQTMMAIQRINPDAFIDNNINLLKKGQVLRGPTEEEAMQLSSREAIAMAAEQNRQWRDKLASRGIEVEADTRQVDLSGRSVSREQDPAPSEDAARLKLVSGAAGSNESGQGGSGDEVTGALRDDLAVAQEDIDRYRLEKEELQLKVTDLEDQLETSEKVLTLKDEQIAALQAKLRELEAQQAAVQAGAADAVESAPVEPVLEEEAIVEEVISDEGVEGQIERDVVVEEEVDYNYEEELPAAVDAMAGDVSDQMPPEADDSSMGDGGVETESEAISAVGVELEEQPAITPTPMEQPVQEKPGLLQQIMQNPVYLAALGGGVVVLLLLGLLAAKRKQQADDFEDDQADNFSMPEADESQSMPEFDSVNLEEDDAFEEAVEASAEEETVPQTSDVIGEADIYIAYGRFPQAIEMLENASEKEPDRADIHLKLCEVCAEANEPGIFMTHYSAVQRLGDRSDISKVNELKDRLGISDEPPVMDSLDSSEQDDFATESDSVVSEPDDLASDFGIGEPEKQEDTSLDFEFDSQPVSEDTLVDVPVESVSGDVAGLDFDLNLDLEDEADSTDSAQPIDQQEGEGNSLDFDTDFSLDADEADVDASETAEGQVQEDNSLSFDSFTSESDETLQDGSVESAESAFDFDLELDSDDTSAPGTEASPHQENDDEPVLDSQSAAQLADELDLDLDGDFLTNETDDSFESPDTSFDSADAAEISASDDFELPDASEPELMQPEPEPETESIEPPPTVAANDTSSSADDLDFLSDEDEASTKLDLARAYIDMGDRDGAKDILDEVMLEGNDNQKQEAKDLLVRLES